MVPQLVLAAKPNKTNTDAHENNKLLGTYLTSRNTAKRDPFGGSVLNAEVSTGSEEIADVFPWETQRTSKSDE